jgi:hypothetical protein
VEGTGSELCPVAGFGISNIEILFLLSETCIMKECEKGRAGVIMQYLHH